MWLETSTLAHNFGSVWLGVRGAGRSSGRFLATQLRSRSAGSISWALQIEVQRTQLASTAAGPEETFQDSDRLQVPSRFDDLTGLVFARLLVPGIASKLN